MTSFKPKSDVHYLDSNSGSEERQAVENAKTMIRPSIGIVMNVSITRPSDSITTSGTGTMYEST